MGWKALKEAFDIEHYIQVTDKGLCIGSSYVHDIVVIDPRTGNVRESTTFRDFLNENYPALKQAKPAHILELLSKPDTFSRNIPVFTYRDAEIIEAQCEEIGWPNITHDGQMMYDNTYSTDKAQVVGWAKRSAASRLETLSARILEQQQALDKLMAMQAETEANKMALDQLYPDIAPDVD